jgi:hypothetical protein
MRDFFFAMRARFFRASSMEKQGTWQDADAGLEAELEAGLEVARRFP